MIHTGIAYVQALQSSKEYQPFAGSIALVWVENVGLGLCYNTLSLEMVELLKYKK